MFKERKRGKELEFSYLYLTKFLCIFVLYFQALDDCLRHHLGKDINSQINELTSQVKIKGIHKDAVVTVLKRLGFQDQCNNLSRLETTPKNDCEIVKQYTDTETALSSLPDNSGDAMNEISRIICHRSMPFLQQTRRSNNKISTILCCLCHFNVIIECFLINSSMSCNIII